MRKDTPVAIIDATMLEITAILHATYIVADLDVALAFYCDILGLKQDDSRPDLGYPGAWLTIGQQQLHLMQLPNPDAEAVRPTHGGRDRHIALHINDFDQLVSVFEQHQIPFTRSKSGRPALFVRDPDGNALEFIGTN